MSGRALTFALPAPHERMAAAPNSTSTRGVMTSLKSARRRCCRRKGCPLYDRGPSLACTEFDGRGGGGKTDRCMERQVKGSRSLLKRVQYRSFTKYYLLFRVSLSSQSSSRSEIHSCTRSTYLFVCFFAGRASTHATRAFAEGRSEGSFDQHALTMRRTRVREVFNEGST